MHNKLLSNAEKNPRPGGDLIHRQFAVIVGFNFYHKGNILCWEISAKYEFCRLHFECEELYAPSSSGLD